MRKILSAATSIVAAAVLVLVAVQPASANSWTAFCLDQVQYTAHNQTGQPTARLQCQMQGGPAAHYGYTGPVNGLIGVNTWAGIQRYLQAEWGYTGPANGIPGPNTYNAMIRAGNLWSYPNGTRPQDGSLTEADWQNFAYLLKLTYFGP